MVEHWESNINPQKVSGQGGEERAALYGQGEQGISSNIFFWGEAEKDGAAVFSGGFEVVLCFWMFGWV